MNKISDLMDGFDGDLPECPAAGELSEKRIAELAMRKIGPKRPVRIKKAVRIMLIAAAIAAALTVTVLASTTPLKVSGENAVEAVNGELEYFYDAGLLAKPVVMDDSAEIQLIGSGSTIYFKWIGSEHTKYNVIYSDEEIFCLAQIDAVTGKLVFVMACNMDCRGMTPVITFDYLDEKGEPYKDPRTGEACAFYNDYGVLISDDITIDGMFDIMCEYWGFDSYELDERYVGANALDVAAESFGYLPVISARFTDAGGNSDTRYIDFSPTASGSYFSFGTEHVLG